MFQRVTVKCGKVRIRTGLPAWNQIKSVDYVDGSLCRISIISRAPDSFLAIIRPPRPSQKQIGCDRCVGQHSPLMLHCTGNFPHIDTPFQPGRLYSIVTGNDVGQLHIIQILTQKGEMKYAECRIET
jgi:hypothetical protein